MSTRDAQEFAERDDCKEHEDFQEGCPHCFEDAVEGGVGWFIFNRLHGMRVTRRPWTSATALDAHPPFKAVFDARYGDDLLFTISYESGGTNNIKLSKGAARSVRLLLDYKKHLRWRANERLDQARRDEDEAAEHRELVEFNRLNAEIDTIDGWVLEP